jgi:hypothetical protein
MLDGFKRLRACLELEPSDVKGKNDEVSGRWKAAVIS